VRKLIKHELKQWGKAAAIAGILVWVIHLYGFSFSIVEGNSMRGTLHNGDRLLVNKVRFVVGKPGVGEVVIIHNPESYGPKYLVKRVVAGPGDTVEIHNRQLYVNGKPVDEPYTDHLIDDGNYGPYIVEMQHYFVMGDNRRKAQSVDSRYFGAVDADAIVGRAEAIVWPMTRWGGL
jgi:signal peptidase I